MEKRVTPQSSTSQLNGDKTKSILQILNGYLGPFLKRSQSPVCSDSNANRVQRPVERCPSEIDGFVFVEQIELSHFSNCQIPKKEENRGHTFERTQLNKPTWCDQCGDFIWGAYKDCLKCHNCDYVCHYKCRSEIAIECQHNGGSHNFGTEQKERIEEHFEEDDNDLFSASPSKTTLTSDDIHSQIQIFNNNQHGLSMSMEDDNRFSGSIRIYLNLFRPVKMILENHLRGGKRSSDSEESESETDSTTKTISFHLPRSTSLVIRINSQTRTRDVIKKFLKKYRIIDNPCKFALYESIDQGEGHASIRRLSDDEYPLVICLNWSVDGLNKRSFILRENDTNDIQWDAFSIPELESFLKILQREELEYRIQIKNKYAQTKSILQHRIEKIERKQLGDDNRTPIFV
ncbi:DgyrCDS11003 [Dimorphilus gyrociliatus]|uniref:DgyrCDS11003 n=1 Tax=Dimorphilus gyrociliatus TaxID=2664684 RepID=A0A7I8W3E0_9ANNE|nr:DgyrCDS11003 [Dimorphilus gyrociliatus]